MQKRLILSLMLVFLLVCNTLVTISINLAIVSMVDTLKTENENDTTDVVCENVTFSWSVGTNNGKSNKTDKQLTNVTTYNWSEAEQNTLLSGYYWLSWLAILPGGLLSQKYGSKIVLGYAQGISSLMSSLIPVFADNGAQALTYIRVVQGFFSLMSIPGAVLTIIGNWIPPNERGQCFSILSAGAIAGFGVGSIIFGFLAEYLGWTYIFHTTSFFGIVWLILWYWLVHDTPGQHPTISVEEKSYILENLKISSDTETVPIPWKEILTSFPFHVSAIAVASISWHFTMLTTYTPKYLKSMYGLNSDQIGFINSIPQLASCISSYFFGFILDYIVKKKWLSITNSRKCFAFVGSIISAVPLIVVAYTTCNITLVVWCFVVAIVARNLSVFGAELALIDMSPKFCGVLQGLAGTLSSILTLFLTGITNYLSDIMSPRNTWTIVFLATGIICIALNLLFIRLGTAKTQPWNSGPIKRKEKQKNMQNVKIN